MNIQGKLIVTYITLLSFGVVVISAYAIISIRTFLLDEATTKFETDANTFAQSLENEEDFTELFIKASFMADLTGYKVTLFDSVGTVLVNAPVDDPGFLDSRAFLNEDVMDALENSNQQVLINDRDLEEVISFHHLQASHPDVHYLRITQNKKDLYAADASIRYLIYGAMIGSIVVVIIVSVIFARYLSRPITQLKEAALDIANGNLDREIDVTRKDEFGLLAKSLNKMAGRLKDDYEKLRMLNEKQNQFFADIAHEVRNPLHTISGAMEMVQVEGLPEEKKAQYFATAEKQIDRVVRLFQDIKSLQRYDMDESFIQKTRFNAAKLVDEVVRTYLPIADEKKLRLTKNIRCKCVIEADYDKMEQVLDNLVSNAIKYTSRGEIIVTLERLDNEVQISVEDTGIGIAAEHLDRLFDRFYRTDKARSRDKGGTGLGLAVVKGILNAHGREIFVESTPGKGTRFFFTMMMTDPGKV